MLTGTTKTSPPLHDLVGAVSGHYPGILVVRFDNDRGTNLKRARNRGRRSETLESSGVAVPPTDPRPESLALINRRGASVPVTWSTSTLICEAGTITFRLHRPVANLAAAICQGNVQPHAGSSPRAAVATHLI